MTIYQFRKTVTTASGSTSSQSLAIPGGICRQVRVIENTSTTVFMASLVDEASFNIMDYGVNTGEFNDVTAFPMQGKYTFNITNASPDDTFKIYFSVEE